MSTQVDLKTVPQKCPAFASGCPFSALAAKTNSLSQVCPAFNSGCPFKSSTDMSSFQSAIQTVPQSHILPSDTPGIKIAETLQNVHKMSVSLKEEVGECPLFTAGCIFKVKCSNLRPLITELDLNTWGLQLENHEEEKESHKEQFSHSIKAGTSKSHRRAESVPFVRYFLRGKVPKEAYATFVGYLYFVYTALEEQSRNNAQNRVYKDVYYPAELNRVESLKTDLKYYFGENWEKEIAKFESVKCVKAYVDRINFIGKDRPELLVAHSYTRYMGDLSGGQVLKKTVQKFYKPPHGEGTTFYEFSVLPTKIDQVAFKRQYRMKLDGMNIDKILADEIVGEANIAFEMNTDIFYHLCTIAGIPVDEKFSSAENYNKEEKNVPPNHPTVQGSETNKCPFQVMTQQKGLIEQQLKPRTDLSYKIHLLLKPYYKVIPRISVVIVIAIVILLIALLIRQ